MRVLRWILAPVFAALLTACGQPEQTQPDQRAEVDDPARQALLNAVAGEHRSETSRNRDQYRNPVETLSFFGLEPDMTVVEVWPGAGWYSEILAPALRDEGRLVAAGFVDDEGGFRTRINASYQQLLSAHPEVFDRVEVIAYGPPEFNSLGEPASADLVLVSRHFHNFIAQDLVDELLAAAHEVLKDGGTLAVIQHRAQPDAVPEREARTGYVREQYLIDTIEAAGFALQEKSDINANPNDPREHPMGVWTLPPSFRACAELEGDEQLECEARYQAIGESDRMTLRFSKR